MAIAAGSPEPLWAWINVLAHGSESMLRRIANQYDAAQPLRTSGQIGARGYVAASLIASVDSGSIDLAEFQRTVLIPLELAALSGTTATVRTSHDLIAGILASLPDRRPNGSR